MGAWSREPFDIQKRLATSHVPTAEAQAPASSSVEASVGSAAAKSESAIRQKRAATSQYLSCVYSPATFTNPTVRSTHAANKTGNATACTPTTATNTPPSTPLNVPFLHPAHLLPLPSATRRLKCATVPSVWAQAQPKRRYGTRPKRLRRRPRRVRPWAKAARRTVMAMARAPSGGEEEERVGD